MHGIPKNKFVGKYRSSTHKGLTREDERRLIKAAKGGDRRAADQLIEAFTPLANKYAFQWRGTNTQFEHRLGEAQLGLFEALNRFELSRGTRFSTYARWWVKAYVSAHVITHADPIHKFTRTSTMRQAYFKKGVVQGALIQNRGAFNETQLRDTARRLRIPDDIFKAALEILERKQTLSLDAAVRNKSGENADKNWVDTLKDESPTAEITLMREDDFDAKSGLLTAALEILNPRDRAIFTRRRLEDDPPTLEDLAAEYGVSRERIRQLETRAFEKIQKRVKERYVAAYG